MKTLKNDLTNLRLILDRVVTAINEVESKDEKSDTDHLNLKKAFRLKDSLEDSIYMIERLIVK